MPAEEPVAAADRRSGSWPRPGQHHQLDPIALALVKLDTAMSRSCQSVLRCGVEPLAPRRLSACLRCRGLRTLTWTADATPIGPVAGLVGGADGGAVLCYGHRAGRKDADRKRNW